MKNLVITFLILGIFSTVFYAQKLKGSDTILPLVQKEASAFNKGARDSVTVLGGGSASGIAALINGTIDIATSSREMNFEEKVECVNSGKNIIQKIIAYDALAIIVNPSNKLSKLNRSQIEGIYTGKISNWKRFGGEDINITVYSREKSSGTHDFFQEYVLLKKKYSNSIIEMLTNDAIIQSVSENEGAIGFVGLAYLNNTVKAIEVAFQERKYVEPSMWTAWDRSYPITRPLYFFYDKTTEEKYSPFLHFVLSKKGQKIVEDLGYVPVNLNCKQPE